MPITVIAYSYPNWIAARAWLHGGHRYECADCGTVTVAPCVDCHRRDTLIGHSNGPSGPLKATLSDENGAGVGVSVMNVAGGIR